jgi:uncharacterized protein YqjF (DUF2071 family)
MPSSAWIMTQTWHDLLFAHWPLAPESLRSRVPSEFELDLFDRRAWIGIVPFYMTNVAPRGVPALPWLSEFAELNVRTYVRAGGKPGVYFFSLDAANPIAVHTARLLLRLPYYRAAMRVVRTARGVSYRSARAGRRPAEFAADYRPVGEVVNPKPGSLEYFLTERYCLYARGRRRRPYRLDIHHPPWPLQPAEAEIGGNSMARASGITLPDTAPLVHFARRQDTVAWPPVKFTS